MPVKIQNAEGQARARRTMGVSGALALSLDEVVVPVAQLWDADQPGLRTDGRGWVSDGDNGQPAVVANNSVIGIIADTRDQVVVVTHVSFRLSAPSTVFLEYLGQFLPDPGTICVDVESTRQDVDNAYLPAGPRIQIRAVVGSVLGSIVGVFSGLITQQLFALPNPCVLRPSESRPNLQLGLVVVTVNVGINAQFFGRTYEGPS